MSGDRVVESLERPRADLDEFELRAETGFWGNVRRVEALGRHGVSDLAGESYRRPKEILPLVHRLGHVRDYEAGYPRHPEGRNQMDESTETAVAPFARDDES